MSETPAENPAPPAHPWLPQADVLTWLQLAENSQLAGVAEWCRRASAAYCERQRPDLFPVVAVIDVETGAVTYAVSAAYAPPSDVVMAGLIGAARVFARRSSPAGLASFGEFGASEVLRLDPDVSRLLGVGRHGIPRVG